MDCATIFKLDTFSLTQLSGIAIAISIWERPDVKKKIQDSFWGGKYFNYDLNKLNDENNSDDVSDVSDGQIVVNYVLEVLDHMKIPDHLLGDIKIAAVKIGQKIFYWRQYVQEVLNLDEKYAEKIYWTPYGQIDELRVVQDFWLRDEKLLQMDHCSCFISGDNSLYCLASVYGQEEFVEKNLKHMKNRILSYLTAPYKKKKWTAYAVITTWMYFCTDEKKTPAVKRFRKFSVPPDELPATEIFWKCLSKGNEFGTKYFWNRLSQTEKQNLVTKAAEQSLLLRNGQNSASTLKFLDFIGDVFVKELSIRLLLFFINQMTETERREFIMSHSHVIFKLFYQIWPYQEICEKMLFQMWDHMSSDVHKSLLDTIFYDLITVSGGFRPDYFTPNSYYKTFFQKLIKKCSKELKVFFITRYRYEVIRTFYRIFDVDLLNLIINDDDLKDHRGNMLNVGKKYLKLELLARDYGTVNNFIETVKLSDEEIKSLKRMVNSLNDFLIRGNLTAAEEHLNWLADTKEERIEFMNGVDAVEINFFLVQNNEFVIADKFLVWRFNTEEERRMVKELIKSEEFLLTKIFELWSGKNNDTTVSEEKCSELLNWYFESHEEIAHFKRVELIQDKYLFEKYWDALYDVNNFQKLDTFLEFCSMTPDEIQMMKINIKNNITWWIETYALEKAHYFGMLQALMDWVYGGNKAERRKVIRNYLNSPRGSLLCLRVFKNYTEKSPSHIKTFFNSWIKPGLNFEQLFLHLEACDDSVFGPEVKSCVKKLLEDRKIDWLVKEQELSDSISYPTFCNKRHYYDRDEDSDSDVDYEELEEEEDYWGSSGYETD